MAEIMLAVGIIAFLLAPSVVCALKGKYKWATIGFITQWHWIPTFRVAKPGSWWARRFYGPEKMDLACARFKRSLEVAALAEDQA